MAESVMRRYEGETLTVGFSIDCACREAGRRIAFYLTDPALEPAQGTGRQTLDTASRKPGTRI